MPSNRGATTLKRGSRRQNPMQDFDRLPDELRRWVSNASLPWSAKSVQTAYNKAFARTGDAQAAFAALDHLQERLVSKDAQKLWAQRNSDI